jgi:hypothetical protein
VRYQIGIVEAETGFGMMLSRKGAPASIEYVGGAGADFRSASRTLISAAMEQVQSSPVPDFRFSVVRKVFNSVNCPGIDEHLATFYIALDSALSAPVSLASKPPGASRIVTDAEDLRIQVEIDSATLSLNRMGQNGHPIASQFGKLWQAVATCFEEVAVSGSNSYSFNYGQAILETAPARQ